MTELYQQFEAVLQNAQLHLYYHFDHKCLMIVPFTDQVYHISDQWTIDEWVRYINERSGARTLFRIYHNPMTKEYILGEEVFGAQFMAPGGFWMLDVDPSRLSSAIGDVVTRVRFSKQAIEIPQTKVVTESGESVYTEAQVIALVRMLRGDLNTPGSDEIIHRLLNAIK